MNRLNKTKETLEVDHEEERRVRLKAATALRRQLSGTNDAVIPMPKAQYTDNEVSERERADRRKKELEAAEDEEWERQQKQGDFDPDEDFM